MNRDDRLIEEAYTRVLEQQVSPTINPAGSGNAKEILDMLIKDLISIKDDGVLMQKINELVRSSPAGKDGNYSELLAKALFQHVKAAQTGQSAPGLKPVPMPGGNVPRRSAAVPMPFKPSKGGLAVPMPGMK